MCESVSLGFTLQRITSDHLVSQAGRCSKPTRTLQELLPDSAGFLHPSVSAGASAAGRYVPGAAGSSSGQGGYRDTRPVLSEFPSTLITH